MRRLAFAVLLVGSTTPYLTDLLSQWRSNELVAISFGAMMPLIAGVACWIRFRTADDRSESPSKTSLVGPLAGLAFCINCLAWVLHEPIVGSVGLWLTAGAVIGVVGGHQRLARYLLPISPLVLTAPLTTGWMSQFEYVLQHISASVAAVWLTIFGYDVEKQGLLLVTPAFHNLVDETCSGVSTLAALSLYTLILGLIFRIRERRLAFLIALALPFSVLVNGARIAIISALGERGGSELAMGPMHDVSGYASFLVGYGLILCLLGWLYRRGLPSSTVSNNDEETEH